MEEKLLPSGEEPVSEPVKPAEHSTFQGKPSPKAQSWGVVISIVVIVMMIVVGAFYAWGQRIAENSQYQGAPANN